MSAHSANRMQVVVLGMLLFAEAGVVIPASRTAFTIAPTSSLGPLSFFVCGYDHLISYLAHSAMPIPHVIWDQPRLSYENSIAKSDVVLTNLIGYH